MRFGDDEISRTKLRCRPREPGRPRSRPAGGRLIHDELLKGTVCREGVRVRYPPAPWINPESPVKALLIEV